MSTERVASTASAVAPTRPSTPWPASARNPATTRKPSSCSRPAARMAAPSGCSLPRSSEAARSSSSVSAKPGTGLRAVTAGRPRVSVPVLSNTTVSIRPADSRACPPRTRMPVSAPRPVPTMIAVGVARPMAQGQAMTTTVTNASQRERQPRLRPEGQPGHEGQRRQDEHDRDEDLADPVGQALDGGLAALGPTDHLDDPGEGGLAAHPGRPEDERAGRVEGGPDDLVADRPVDRDGLAGDHRLVDRRSALDDDPVDRHLVAGPDPDQVARIDLGQVDVDFAARPDDAGRLRGQTDQAPDRAGGAALRPALEPATEEDQPDDDRRRVEVGLRAQTGPQDDLGKSVTTTL